MNYARRLPVVPAPALVLGSMVGIQAGQAFGKEMFGLVGPLGVVTLRFGFTALILLLLRQPRPQIDRRSLALIVGFGTAIAGISFFLFPALQRLPVGAAVTLQFLGPLAVAIGGSRRVRDLVWIALAGFGVFLFGNPTESTLDLNGMILAFASGACWAGYILLTKRAGDRADGDSILTLAAVWAAIFCAPVGVIESGAALLRPDVLLAGFGVAVLSAVVPWSLDMAALRRLPPRIFSVLVSLEPALGGLAGLLIVGERLAPAQWIAIGCVVAASVGVTVGNGRGRARGPR